MSTPITIVDYGMGNIGSLVNMFRRIGCDTEVSGKIEVIAKAKKILLPGVGTFDAAMERIDGLGLRDLLRAKAVIEGVPFLGICLGMQVLVDQSEEGVTKGLGLISGAAHRFSSETNLKVPHMGWNQVDIINETPLTEGLPQDPRFYFVHSYYVKVHYQDDVMMRSKYGREFDAAINRGNVYGAQFHPEKSHNFGMAMLKNFVNLPC